MSSDSGNGTDQQDLPGDVTARTWRNTRETTVTGRRVTVVEDGEKKKLQSKQHEIYIDGDAITTNALQPEQTDSSKHSGKRFPKMALFTINNTHNIPNQLSIIQIGKS